MTDMRYATADPDTVEVVTDEEAAIIRSQPTIQPPTREAAPHILALREGAMLFIPGEGDTSWHARLGDWPRRHGKRVRQRRGERNGTAGHFVWLEEAGSTRRRAAKPKRAS